MEDPLQRQVAGYVQNRRHTLVEAIQALVRCPSENTPPHGNEGGCQQWLSSRLRAAGLQPDVYELDTVPTLTSHPRFYGGRNYRGRPNLAARRKGSGGGRSLILSGHIDTVPRGAQPWTRGPFSGAVENNRIYGRGSNDMKAGVATNLFVCEALNALGIRLRGDLIFESVVDEEFGGVNGTLAGRLRGYLADAAVISEPSFLRVCAAQRGGRTVHITFSGAPGGVLGEGPFPGGVVEQVSRFLAEVPRFAAARRANVKVHPLYAHSVDPVPVSVMKIFTAPWGTSEPMTVPVECRVEMYWELMPGETQEEVDREFFSWLDALVNSAPGLFPHRPRVVFPIRWLPGSAIGGNEPLVREIASSAASVLGRRPLVTGIDGPCDMYIFHEFGIPAVLWGARGGNTHAADEYVEIDSAVAAAQALLLFVCRWCGVGN